MSAGKFSVWSVFLLALFLAFGGGCQRTVPEDASRRADRKSNAVFRPTPEIVAEHDRGVALMGQFDYVAAHTVFEGLLEQHPTWLDAKIDLAIAKLNRRQADDVERSEVLLDEVIVADPDRWRAKYCRAILLLFDAEPGRALRWFKEVVEADPNDAYAIYYAGQCLLDTRQYELALGYFERAQKADPYLRSAYYGAFQTLQRLNRVEEAMAALKVFQKLAGNPQARSAEIKYSRMGPKAEAQSMLLGETPHEGLTGELFAASIELVKNQVDWAFGRDAGVRPGVTVCDINNDGKMDLFLAGALADSKNSNANAVLLQTETGWRVETEHPLTNINDVNAVLWGDFDNDSLVDAYFCRNGPNQCWRQAPKGQWSDVTESTRTAGNQFNTMEGAIFDADHDGDLDLFLVNSDGPNELLNNNLDGTFRAIGEAQGVTGGEQQSIGVVVADLDSDRDADLVVLNQGAPHQVFLNDRLWNYSAAEGFDAFQNSNASSAVAADTNADGQVELITNSGSVIRHWQPTSDGDWRSKTIECEQFEPAAGPLAIQDMNGDGRLDLVASTVSGWAVLDCFGSSTSLLFSSDADIQADWALANLALGNGYAVVAAREGKPRIWSPGRGRHSFADVSFTGKENKADQMRSNASGIGIQAAARVGGRWTALQTFRDQSGPGQSRQPIAVGLGNQRSIDFVKLLWPDGLFQTELGLVAGETHRIEETQRQVSSCPVLFVWNGETHEFVSDILGVGGLGFNSGKGEYHPPRPWENLMLPDHLPQKTSEGRYRIKIGEPMEEACYLDAIRLVAYELPDGWQMTMDERQAVDKPLATGKPIFYRHVIEPVSAKDSLGADVLAAVRTADGQPMPAGKRDPRFLAHAEPFSIALKFDRALDDLPGRPVLVIDGWVEYPYSQTMFASWQAGADYSAPTLEARTEDGEWHIVYKEFGYPAGMPRQMSLPINQDDLPDGTTELRLSTSMEVYWDRIVLVVEEPCDAAKKIVLDLSSAVVQEVGFPQRKNLDFRRPEYDYEKRSPLWDTRHSPGYYTNFGNATPLLEAVDDAVAIIGPGEEVEIEFDSTNEATSSARRVFVLECHGWCKDMDLYTENGETLGPLPRRVDVETSPEDEADREKLHEEFNQRFRAG